MRWPAVVLSLLLCLAAGLAEAAVKVRVGVLQFGTVSWELDTLTHHGIARDAGIDLEVVPYATPQATQVALQGGAVDMIVADWLWVARQRAEGADFTFVPYSHAVGALMVRPVSGIDGIAGLKGRRIGVAGGPLDKNWLLLRNLARRDHGFDPESEAEPVFGAPPLLNELARSGEIDAVLTYWHFAARLQAQGLRRVADVTELASALGAAVPVPFLGYVFHEDWAGRHREALVGLFAAIGATRTMLDRADDEWQRLRPLMRAEDEATFVALRDGFRAGTPRRWGDRERYGARKLFALLAEIGGPRLVGEARTLPDGTFWGAVRY